MHKSFTPSTLARASFTALALFISSACNSPGGSSPGPWVDAAADTLTSDASGQPDTVTIDTVTIDADTSGQADTVTTDADASGQSDTVTTDSGIYDGETLDSGAADGGLDTASEDSLVSEVTDTAIDTTSDTAIDTTSDPGLDAAPVCGAAPLNVSGGLDGSGTVSFDSAAVTLSHADSGCISRIEFALSYGLGCALTVVAEDAYAWQGGLRVSELSFDVDSECPGLAGAAEGSYVNTGGLTLAEVVPSVTHVPDTTESTSCFATSLTLKLSGQLVRLSDGATLDVGATEIVIMGEVTSVLDAGASCPCAGGCAGAECGDDGCGFSCGTCDNAPLNGGPVCGSDQLCGFECAAGFHTCGSSCLADTSPASCGSSCTACPEPANATATCDGSSCGFVCDPSYHLCGGACVSDASPASCGSSCTACPEPANATATCDGSSCGFVCDPGYHLCGGACVSDASPASCGSSCTPCSAPSNATATCELGSCDFVCDAGYHRCGDVCEPVGTTPDQCGTSCSPCTAPANAVATCESAGDVTLPAVVSCQGDCGGNGGDCWCDPGCVDLGDCCADYEMFCGGGGGPSGYTCSFECSPGASLCQNGSACCVPSVETIATVDDFLFGTDILVSNSGHVHLVWREKWTPIGYAGRSAGTDTWTLEGFGPDNGGSGIQLDWRGSTPAALWWDAVDGVQYFLRSGSTWNSDNPTGPTFGEPIVMAHYFSALYMAWTNFDNELYLCTESFQGQWDTQLVSTDDTRRAHVAFDGGGGLHMAFVVRQWSSFNGAYDYDVRYSDGPGGSELVEYTIKPSSRVRVAPDGTQPVVFFRATDDRLIAARKLSGTWSDAVIADTHVGDFDATVAQGVVHACYHDITHNELRYYADGNVVTIDTGGGEDCAIAIDATGAAHFSYAIGSEVRYATTGSL